MNQTIQEKKKRLREAMIAERDKMPLSERSAHSKKISSQLWSILLEDKVKVIHSYLPMRSEVDIRPLLQKALDNAITVVVPKTLKNRKIENLVLRDLQNLEVGLYGTLHPKDAEEYKGQYDLIIVPGLAFDDKGHRVGYGGGYYDTFLSEQQGAKKIGLAYPFQLMDALPVEPHDICLDAIVC